MKRAALLILFIAACAFPAGARTIDLTTDLTIEKALQMALENNKNYKISRQQIQRYRYKVKQNLHFLPIVTLEGSKTLDEKSIQLQLPPLYPGAASQWVAVDFTKDYEFKFQIIQPLFTGGKNFFLYKNARLDLEMAREKERQAREELKFQVKKVFYNILVMKELLSAHRQALDLAENNYMNINEKFKLGMVSKYDLLQARLAVESVRPDILKVEKILELSQLQLKFMIGIPENSQLNITGDLDYEHHDAPSPSQTGELIHSAQENCSLVNQMELQIRKNNNLLKIAYGQFLPRFSLAAAYHYRSGYFNFRENNWDKYFSVNLVFQLPLFVQGKRTAQIGELKISKKILNTHLDQVKEATRLDIHRLTMTLAEERQNIFAGLKNIGTAEEGLRVARLTYDEGLISVLELNHSTTQLTKARVRLLQAVYNYNITQAELEKICRTSK